MRRVSCFEMSVWGDVGGADGDGERVRLFCSGGRAFGARGEAEETHHYCTLISPYPYRTKEGGVVGIRDASRQAGKGD